MSFRRILVPLDGTPLAERALYPATVFAEAMNATLVLLRVAVPLSLKLDPELYEYTIKLRQNAAKNYLQRIQSSLISSKYRSNTASYLIVKYSIGCTQSSISGEKGALKISLVCVAQDTTGQIIGTLAHIMTAATEREHRTLRAMATAWSTMISKRYHKGTLLRGQYKFLAKP